jgi:hypothetical protein
MHDFISEQAAINLTGMSSTTLTRFAEAGYLQQDIDSDGLRFYSKTELVRVFGSAPSGDYTPPKPVEMTQGEPAQSCHVVLPEEDVTMASPVAEPVPVETPDAEPSPQVVGAISAAPASIVVPSVDSEAAARAAHQEAELVRLRNLVQMQEKILDLKDSSLEALRKERDWLRVRVERLEEKSDRDQLLLLSETQTIRKLIIMSDRRRSAFRQLMEWVGIVEKPETERLIGHTPVVETSSPPDMARPSEKRAANG